MRITENWNRLRLKILPVGIILGLIFFSFLKRIVHLFFSVLLVVTFVSVSSAGTWNDVLVWQDSNPAPSGCFYVITTTVTPSWRVWKRCTPESQVSYSQASITSTDAPLLNTTKNTYYACDGTVNYSGSTGYIHSVGARCSNQACTVTASLRGCDGTITTQTETNTPPAINSLTPSTPTATNMLDIFPCVLPSIQVSNCAASDVLVTEILNTGDNCNYDNLQSLGVTYSTGTGFSYGLNYPDTGTENPCNQCIPDGTRPDTAFKGNASQAPYGFKNPDGTISCVFSDVVGDPALLSDTFTPSVAGGGSTGDTGAPVVSTGEKTTTTNTGPGGAVESVSVSTNTVTKQDGSTTTTQITTLTNCIDANADGISDISGLACGGSVTSSSTPATGTGSQGFDSGSRGGTLTGGGGTKAFYPQLTAPGAYSNADLPTVTDFGTLLDTFFNDMKATPLFSQFTLNGMAPGGGGTPVYSVDFGRFGNQNVDFSSSQYTAAFSIIKGFMLLLASYLAVRIVVLKR